MHSDRNAGDLGRIKLGKETNMKKFAIGIMIAAMLLLTVYVMPRIEQVEAQEAFQLTVEDCKIATQAINKGHAIQVWQIVNACFADQKARDAVTAQGFGPVLKSRLKLVATHNTTVRELAEYIKDGHLSIEVDGKLVPVDNITIDETDIKIVPTITPPE